MNNKFSKFWCLFLLLIALFSREAIAQKSDTLFLKQGLTIQLARGISETIISSNPIEASLALGTWKAPKAGDKVSFQAGETREWKPITINNKGWFADSTMRGSGYIFVNVDIKQKTTMILRMLGNDMVYVNGAPRTGNTYGTTESHTAWENNFDFCFIPVELKAGKNELLFRLGRGRLKAMLLTVTSAGQFIRNDLTAPDFLVNDKIDMWGAINVINTTTCEMKDLYIKTVVGDNQISEDKVSLIQPTSLRKTGFHMLGGVFTKPGKTLVKLILLRKNGSTTEVLDTVSVPIRIMNKSDNHKETFISGIDGSVQYYGVNPQVNYDRNKPTALFLSVHGAGVDAVNQSGSYLAKSWGIIVAPTNRRPYGFNWEDWGRLDAMEVLGIAKKKYNIDENRVYLTGHSMGGHGTWHLGAMYPDQFAAIAPSAGWISFWSYRFRGQTIVDTSAIRKMIRRSTTPSETMAYAENYKQLGVYIIHGEIDDNVSINQAKMMIEQLQKIGHKDFQYHFEPGANHWWDNSPETGADCVDWYPMFDFLARHARPLKERIRQIDFLTSNPGISARNNWLVVDAQKELLNMSEVHIVFNPGSSSFVGTTVNVARLAFDLDMLNGPGVITVNLDKQKIENIPFKADLKQLWLENVNGKWAVASQPAITMKGASRYGTFKEAFRNRMQFVYGTKGTIEENKWAFNKARFDSEKFWYQGNGSIDVIADVDFNATADSDRSVIIYGNRKTNMAWSSLLSDSPVQVDNGFIIAGTKKYLAKDLSCLFVRPRAGSATASVGVISGSGIIGMRLTDRLPYMSPGIGLPDCIILNSNVMAKGEEGVLMTGFFGLDWSLENGDFVWNNK